MIDKFNISLHSLNENEYNAVTGTVNCLNKVKRNINQLRQKFPDVSLSINVTLLPGINNNPITIGGLIDYAVSLRAGIKLIAKYTDSDHDDKVFQNIIKILTSRGFQLKNGSLRKIRYNNGLIDLYLTRVLCDAVEFSSNKQTFCQDNNDIIVAEGTKLLTCRKNNYYIDIEEALRQRDTKMLQKKIAKCISLLGSYCGKENSCGYQEKGNN